MRTWGLVFIATGWLVVGSPALAAQRSSDSGARTPDCTYRLTYPRAGEATVRVEISWPDALDTPRALVVPRAIPMGYGEQRYDDFVADLSAFAATGERSTPERAEGPRWQLSAGTTRVAYAVDLRRMEQDIRAASDASRIRDGYLSVLGYSVFAYVDGFESRGARLLVEGPPGWPVFSTLAPRAPAATAPIDARATDFYALADGQIVMGPRATVRRLGERPVPLYFATYAEGEVDLDRVARLAATAFERVIDYFGAAPFPHYTVHHEWLTPVSPRHAYGMSMEHLDSSTYYLSSSLGLTAASTAQDDARVLYNFAHHVAHSWVPKRMYGEGYFPFTWELAPVLDSIWFAEGFGQYAAIMAIASGRPDASDYRAGMLARRFQSTLDDAPPFLRRMGLIELSRVASTRYAEDFRTGRLTFSRGGLMAAALDDRIQAETRGARTLSDVFRYVMAWTDRERRGFSIDELADLVRQATGVEVADVITRWLQPLP